MPRFHYWLILGLCLGNCFFAQAEFVFSSTLEQAYKASLSFKIEHSRKLCKVASAENPNNNLVVYFEHINDFLEVFINENKTLFDQKSIVLQQQLKTIEKDKSISGWKNYILAEMQLHQAMIHIKFSEYFSAAIGVRRALNLCKENMDQYPNFALSLKPLSVLDIVIGSMPDNYKWAVRLIGLDGQFNRGISNLNALPNLLKNNRLEAFIPEVKIIHAFLLLNLKNKESAWSIIQSLNETEKNNLLYIFCAANIARNTSRNEWAILLLKNRPQGGEIMPFPYLDYLTGVCLLNKLDPTADVWFSKYMGSFHGNTYLKDCCLRLGWSKLLQNKKLEYYKYMGICQKIGNTNTDPDKAALKESQRSEPPQLLLLKARLLFDGGYYNNVLELLNSNEIQALKSNAELTELAYRLGRTYQESGKTESAIAQYTKALVMGAKLPEYFAAASALKLGSIYENLNNKKEAEYYYKRCLDFKNHPFVNSFGRQSKAGLNRINRSN